MLTDKQQAAAAKKFAKDWEGEHSEDQDAQSFWGNLLEKVFGIEDASQGKNKHINFEKRVKLQGTTKKIDGYIPSTRVLIENKSSHIRLDQPEPFPGKPNPIIAYGQAKEYDNHLPYHEKAEWIITCNFKEFWIYDMKEPENIRKPVKILLSNLGRDYKQLRMLVDNRSGRIIQEEEVSVKAGELVKKMYNLLEKQYPELDENARQNLNILCVRIVFCLYAEDAGVFDRNQFHDYLARYDATDFGEHLEKLFEVLNTPEEERSLSLSEHLKAFPYTNGGLFAEKIQVPPFTDELRTLILDKASLGFNWSNISPTIFGALFESTINPETRKKGGMHYTSIENIHKVIDPLFLDSLKQELEFCLKKRKNETNASQRQRLADFQDKLASLRFLDPACGSGNFLTETYLSLREIENTIIRNLYKGTEGSHNIRMALANPIKVSINQFYGIEINDFAVSVASVALWISEAKMLKITEDIIGHEIEFLPLKTFSNIHEGNALRMEWSDVIPLSQLDYIIGNPPFIGYKEKTSKQKADLVVACKNMAGKTINNIGSLDYVCGWYYKAAQYIQNNNRIKASFVSTNSITQGEQVALHWRCLFDEYNISIDYAYKSFVWNNEADENAAVHCVIVGFSMKDEEKQCILFNEKGQPLKCKYINGYLYDTSDVWIYSKRRSNSAPFEIKLGVHLLDNHYYIFSPEEKDAFIKKEPNSEIYFKKWISASDFLYGQCRYYLDLCECPPDKLRGMPLCYERVKSVLEYRKGNASARGTILEEDPFRQKQGWKADCPYIVIPNTSSENREYLPIDFMNQDTVVTMPDLAIPNGDLYTFGILSSCVHMAWIKTVCGRLEMRFRYANGLVYNNFPWPKITNKSKIAIEKTAKEIINARKTQSNSSSNLADLYDIVSMPPNLRQAHKENDLAVMKAYGFSSKMTEEEIVKELFNRYSEITR